jgi:hypothetical protein
LRPRLHTRFVLKAKSAFVSAIEVYNRPSFEYREETFAILATNAWEILLKARILQLNGESLRSIRVYENKRTRAGTASRRKILKKNRSGTAMTLSMTECINALGPNATTAINASLRQNIEALIEIRDAATHFIHASEALKRQTFAIAAASVKNFVEAAREWFNTDMSREISLTLPLAFLSGKQVLSSVVVSNEEGKLIEHLASLVAESADTNGNYHVALNVDVKFERSRLDSATKVRVTNDPNAVKVVLTEENIRDRYPWDYGNLTQQLTNRYSDFVANQRYHSLRKALANDPKFARERYLDPGNAKSPKKTFFNPNIVNEFDKHYQLATVPVA